MNRLSFALFLILATGCDQTQPAAADHAPLQPEWTEEELQARIPSHVSEPYARDQYPKLYAMLSEGNAETRIQHIREGAARQAMRSGRCDRVEVSEISNNRSSKASLVAFVDCSNGERFYVSEAELEANHPLTANSEKTIDAAQAIDACVQAARSMATFPALMDPHIWTGSSYSTYRRMGSARVTLDFDATNAFGQKRPYTANCLFPAGSTTPELKIAPRR